MNYKAMIQNLIRTYAYGISIYDPIEDVHVQDYGKLGDWYRREAQSAEPHPAIFKALEHADPADVFAMVREYPHMSDDGMRLAYTRNDADGERNRQTVTSVAKYLTRHFPTLPSHVLRDISLMYSNFEFHLWDTVDDLVGAVQDGPRSCMQWDDDDIENRGGHHPYEVYTPDLGWRMAVRKVGGRIVGRCLCNVADDRKIFVRSYKSDADGGYSHSDEALEFWLRNEHGFSKSISWYGCAFKYIRTGRGDGDFLAPYLDGDCKEVNVVHRNGTRVLSIVIDDDEGGEYCCDNTDGTADAVNHTECACCGERTDPDDGIWVGYHSDEYVGPCCSDSYTLVLGRRGHEYYINDDNAIYCNGAYYDPDYINDNNIVELHNGDYEHIDNCVEIDGEWYHHDDDDVVMLQDTDEYAIKGDGCWECHDSGDWYSDSVDFVEIDGKTYHPENATALEAQDEQQTTEE